VPARHDGVSDARDLVRGLAGPEDDLRESLTRGSVMIDPGEAEVLNGGLIGQQLGPGFRVGRVQASLSDRVEQRAKGDERRGDDFRFCHCFDV
jgi:hypothetical protein